MRVKIDQQIMKATTLFCAANLLLLALAGCSTAPKSQADRDILEKEADVTNDKFKAADPDLKRFYDSAAGYATFPSITKGGWILGGARGRGMLYERSASGLKTSGYVDVTHATIGLQWGGQTFSQVVFLQNEEAVNNFKYGRMKLNGSISAVAATAGASKNGEYAEHVAIFTLGEAGLMVEGAVGGQKFGYKPKTP